MDSFVRKVNDVMVSEIQEFHISFWEFLVNDCICGSEVEIHDGELEQFPVIIKFMLRGSA